MRSAEAEALAALRCSSVSPGSGIAAYASRPNRADTARRLFNADLLMSRDGLHQWPLAHPACRSGM
eukprot:8981207-Heterocapsa_arctica.AAC.1